MPQNEFTVKSPCHPEHDLNIETTYVGRDRGGDVPTGFWCDAPGCLNEWDIHGQPR